MEYIHNREIKSLKLKKEDISKAEKRDEIIKETEHIRTQILPKFLSSDNLSFLISNGCSYCAGSKPINDLAKTAKYKDLLSKFRFSKDKIQPDYQKAINGYANVRPEQALDNLYQIKHHFDEIIEDKEAGADIDALITDFKKSFLEEFVLGINYSKNGTHKQFIKRVISRDSKLSRVNVFTLNYDLLIEKTAEQSGIYVNNGFFGFQDRHFSPASYQLDLHLNNTTGGKKYNRTLNLFKLHGSISWCENAGKPPYGISEKQLFVNEASHKISYDQIKNEAIIYPVQSKKKHSLDLPYSELFRQFVEALNRQRSVLIVIGYSFLDEHVNDILTNALANPDFNLVVFCFDEPQKSNSSYYKNLWESSKEDNRITILKGDVLGDFESIVKYLMPYSDASQEDIVFKTFQELQKLNASHGTGTV